MKKQLLILSSIFLMAIFANIAKADTGCVSTNGLTPSTNVPYEYVVNIPATNQYNGDGHFNWYITQDVNLLTGTILTPGTEFNVNTGIGLSEYNIQFGSPGTTSNKLGLTWLPASTGNTYYLVLRYREQNDSLAGCSPENIRVWKIIPNEATNFVLAIYGSNAQGDSLVDASGCAGVVDSAVIQTLTNKVKIIYAPNNLYFLVKASGATTNWTPSILLPDITANATYEQHYGSAQWSYVTDLVTWNDFNLPVGGTMGGVFNSATNATVTETGTYILVKVQVNNRMYETLANQPFEVAVDGVLADTGQKDIWGEDRPDGTNPCDVADDWARKAIFTIIARPNVTPAAGMGPFVTQLPN